MSGMLLAIFLALCLFIIVVAIVETFFREDR
jgi:hypothetical protein